MIFATRVFHSFFTREFRKDKELGLGQEYIPADVPFLLSFCFLSSGGSLYMKASILLYHNLIKYYKSSSSFPLYIYCHATLLVVACLRSFLGIFS